MRRSFWWFVGLRFRFLRAGNAFWSLLLQLATQVSVPGVSDAALTWTSRAALRWGALSPKKARFSVLLTATLFWTPGASPGLTGGQFLRKSAILGICSIHMEFYV